jgi:hypothetical protein
VKTCAPLAKGGWSIFVVKENEHFRYGLFRAILHSLATAAEESMGDLGKTMLAMWQPFRPCGTVIVFS